MFTVVICDERIVSDCYEKYSVFIRPLLESKDFAFCRWNTQADYLDAAVPELKDLIKTKKQWRAIIVNDRFTWDYETVNTRNPFDVVKSKRTPQAFSSVDEILEYRQYCHTAFDRALENPLAKLAIWLCGAPIKTNPAMPYMQQLEDPMQPQYFQTLQDVSVSAVEAEMDMERARRFEQLSQRFVLNGELFNAPKSVVALSERLKNVEIEAAAAMWESHNEFDYSRFYLDNLYPEKLRYLLYDLPCIRGVQDETEYFKFLVTILLLATNKYPDNSLNAGRVYNIDAHIDTDMIGQLCRSYNSKLCSTLIELDNIDRRMGERMHQPVERDVVKENFESDTTIPVEIDVTFDTDEMLAKSDRIGLSKDCPENEFKYWDTQYSSIIKVFLRYLREPRRAVKAAVKGPFRSTSRIEDERALGMNEDQIEDVELRLQEEERNMVETATTRLFDTKGYTQKLENANKEITREISQRMTKKKTVYIGLGVLAAYLFGFLPLIFSNLNSVRSFLFSAVVVTIALVLFAAVGLITLVVFRHRLLKRFADFNDVMSEVLNRINDGLSSFSEYLSHACNVMRQMSVLRYVKNGGAEKRNIIKLHRHDIENQIAEVNRLFSKYLDAAEYTFERCEPYRFDFTANKRYDYDVPYAKTSTRIEFMQPGYEIAVPVEFVESVTMRREELYD